MKYVVLLTLCLSCWFTVLPATIGYINDEDKKHDVESDVQEARVEGIDSLPQAVQVEKLPNELQQEGRKEDEKIEEKNDDFKEEQLEEVQVCNVQGQECTLVSLD